MKFSLTRLFIKRPTLVFVIIALMTFAGVLSTMTIVKELYPNISQPTVSISVQYSGASVTEMRDNIVQPIEQTLAGTPDLETFNSVVQQGQARITAIFDINSETATDLALVNKDIQSAERFLPTNLTPPTVNLQDPTQTDVVTLALYSKKLSLSRLALYAVNVIAPQLEQVPGISFVNVGGVVIPAYEVIVDPARLAAANLTLNDVINTLQLDNQRVPGGFAYEPNRQTAIDIRGDIQNLDTVRNLAIITAGGSGSAIPQNSTGSQVQNYGGGLSALPGVVNPWTASNAVVRIGDVANVVEGYEPRLQYAHISGKAGLFMSVQKASNGSEVDASNATLRALPQIERQFPEISFRVINVRSKFTQQQIVIVTRTLALAIFFTCIAMLFFLRSWRNAIVVCISIPTSLAIAVTVMKLLNMTIDTVSLLGMSLVIGILVDDSTVVLENIERHFTQLRQPPEEAAVRGREEIGAAAVVITLVDVVVFFPIAFIQGQVGRQIAEFAIVVVISTLTSLFVSFTITPTLAGLWALRSHWKPWAAIDWFGRKFDDVRTWYTDSVLPWSLEHGRLVAVFCGATFVLALALVGFGLVGEEFIPPVDRGEIFIQLIYPIGTPIDTVTKATFALEQRILDTPDTFANTAVAGAYAASFGGFVSQNNVGQVHVWLKDDRRHSTDYWVAQFRQIAHKTLPNVTLAVVPSTSTGGGNAQPIDLLVTDLTGGDPTPYAQQVFRLLQTVPGATSVNSTGTELAPEISIQFERNKAQALGIDLGQAAQAAGAAFGGNVATQFETTSGLEQVQAIYPQSYQTNINILKSVAMRSSTGGIVYLGDIARFVSTPTAPLVTRTDRRNVIHVNANYAPNSSLSAVENGFFKRLRSLHLPPNIVVRAAPLGQQDFMHQTLVGMGLSMIVSVILAYLLMVALYNSYLSPFIIIFSVPVAAIGAIGALLLTHRTLNLFSLIGTMLLIGIATKNGILLVDYANTLRTRGLDKLSAIKESAYTRFRPIIMTSFSVVAGNVPLALALDPGSSSRSSLGIVVIGGVLSSLVLTLLLIPNIYMWVAPKEHPSPNGVARAAPEQLTLTPTASQTHPA